MGRGHRADPVPQDQWHRGLRDRSFGAADQGETAEPVDQKGASGQGSICLILSCKVMDTPESTVLPLLDAVAFAARAHRPQLRKDNQTPYVSHVFRVCLIVRHVFGVTDS